MTRLLSRLALLGFLLPAVLTAAPQARRELTLDAKKYAFHPTRIEAVEGDIIRVTLVAADIPHSFTIDDYRIAKRAEPGKPVTFDLLCDKAGTFRFYCNLMIDDGCKKMAGELVVKKR